MANLYITEYARGLVIDGHSQPVPLEPAITTQVVAFTGTAGTSAAFHRNTALVRIETDSIASIIFGTDPTATTSHPRFIAGQTEYRGVTQDKDLKVSAIVNT